MIYTKYITTKTTPPSTTVPSTTILTTTLIAMTPTSTTPTTSLITTTVATFTTTPTVKGEKPKVYTSICDVIEHFKVLSYIFGGKKVTSKFKYIYEGKEKVDEIEANRVYIVLEMLESGEKIVCRAWIDSKCEIVKANVCHIYYGVVSQDLTGKQAIIAAKNVARGIAQYTMYCKSVGMLGIVFSDEGAIIPSQLQEKYDVKATKVTLTISGKTYSEYRIEIKGKEGP